MPIACWKVLLLSIASLMVLAPRTAVAEAQQMTVKQFLARCDRLDPFCRDEFVLGLQAVYAGRLACPERIDVNTPITRWLGYMHRRIAESPSLGDRDKNYLQLEAFMRLWPCPNK